MPFDALTTSDNFRVQGSMTIINDPQGNAGNLNVAGGATVSGSVSAVSGLAVSGNLTATNNATISGSVSILSGLVASSGVSLTGGLQYDVVSGGLATTTTVSQLLSGTSSSITMTGSGRTIFLNPTATESTCILTPTSGVANGLEVTLVNLHPSSASTITIPTGSAGIANGSAITISGGNAAKLVFVTALGGWMHVV